MTTSPADTRMLHREILVDHAYATFVARARATGRLIVDIGANSGLAALYFSREAPGLPVLALEPAPPTYSCLVLNLLRHVPAATAVQTAVGEESGAVTLTYYPRTPSQSGLHADAVLDDGLTAGYLRNVGFDDDAIAHVLRDLHQEVVEHQVPCQRLEEILDAFYPGLSAGVHLKIDAERAELGILRSVGAAWERVDGVVCEVEDDRSGRMRDAVGILEHHGLQVEVAQEEKLRGTALWVLTASRA